jgi:hypothetical protein
MRELENIEDSNAAGKVRAAKNVSHPFLHHSSISSLLLLLFMYL